MEKLEGNKIRKIINVQDEIKKIELLNKEDLSDASKTYIIVNMSDKNKMKALQHIKLNDVQKLMIYYSIEDRKILDELINNNAIAKVRKNIENIKQKYSDTMCTSNLPAQMSTGYEFETNGILASIIDNNGFIVEGWKSDYDESIFNGIEIISPVLIEGNKDDIRNLYWVCDIMKDLELEVTDGCGGHIHYGANFLDSCEAYKIFLEIWGNCEKIIFMMCNGEGQRLRICKASF